MEKLLAMNTAAMLAQAVIGRLPASVGAIAMNAASPGTLDPTVKAVNLLEWEIFRVFYAAIISAAGDEVNWPSPKTPAIAQNVAQTIVQSITSAISGAPAGSPLAGLVGLIPQLGGLIQSLIPAPQQAPPANLPAPGAPVVTSPPATPAVPPK